MDKGEMFAYVALLGMVVALAYCLASISVDTNTVQIEVTQVKTYNFQKMTSIYDHGGGVITFWGVNHTIHAGHTYLITYRSGFVHPTILDIKELS